MHFQLLQHPQHRKYVARQATFAQTLITAAKVLRIDPQPIITKIETAKIKLPCTSLEKA